MSKLNAILEFKKTYANWLSVLYLYQIKHERTIKIKLRNGVSLTVPREMVSVIKELSKGNKLQNGFNFDSSDQILTFPYSNKIVKMKFYEDGKFNGEMASFCGDYNFLEPIKGNTVIDIGANIADSSVWFAIEGSSIVIGLEPYRWSYSMAVKNIKINNLEDRIVLLNAGYGPDGTIEIEDKVTDIGTELKEYKGGIKTPLLTLRTILNNYSELINGELLLKMDCEGCEYNILTEEGRVLRKFKRILIEYHYGYENIKNKLEENGFEVKYTEPHKWYDKGSGRNLIQGYIYAKQISSNQT